MYTSFKYKQSYSFVVFFPAKGKELQTSLKKFVRRETQLSALSRTCCQKKRMIPKLPLNIQKFINIRNRKTKNLTTIRKYYGDLNQIKQKQHPPKTKKRKRIKVTFSMTFSSVGRLTELIIKICLSCKLVSLTELCG